MQLPNQYNLRSHNVSLVANCDDGSSLGQGSLASDSSDGSPAYLGDAAGLPHEWLRQRVPRMLGGGA